MIKKTIKRNELIYLSAYCIYLVVAMINVSYFSRYLLGRVYKGAFLLCIMVFFVSCLLRKRKYSDFCFLIGILGIAVLAMISTESIKRIDIMAILLFSYFARDIKFDIIAKCTILLQSIFLFAVIFMAKTGIIANYVSYRALGGRREYLGFLYPLHAPSIWENIVLLYLYLRRNKITLKELLLIGGISYWIFQKTDARLTFYLMIVIIVYALLTKGRLTRVINNRFSYFLMVLVYPLCGMFSIWMAFIYSNRPWQIRIDTLLGGRIRLAHDAIGKYGIHLLGKPIEWVGYGLQSDGKPLLMEYNYVDNTYVQVLIQFGILLFIIFLLYFTFLQVFFLKTRNQYMLFVFSIIAIHGLIDDSIISLIFNSFLVMIGAYINERRELDKRKKIRHIKLIMQI